MPPAVLAPRVRRPYHRQMRRLHADLILVACAAIWGLAFVFQKSAMAHVGPLLFIACRATVAAIALAPLAWNEARRAPKPAPTALWRTGATAGLAFFMAAALQQAGIVTASVTNTGFLTALYVVIVPLLAWAWHRKRPSPAVWVAVALSACGTWLLGGASFSGLGSGDLLVAASALFWAAHVIITGIATRHTRPVTFSALQFATVAVLGLMAAFTFESPNWAAVWQAATEIAYVGLLSSALTFTLLAVAMRHTPPSEAAVLVSLETVFAALAGALLLGERLAPIGWIGAALIFTAALLVQLAPMPARS